MVERPLSRVPAAPAIHPASKTPRAPRVIHTAQALVDVILEVPALPARGQNVMASSMRRYAGGAVTTLLAAARSGAAAVHAGAVGTGPNGDLIRAALAADGVGLVAPPVEDEDTGVCVVLVEPSAERTFVTTLGAERRLTVEALAASEPGPGDLVCVSGYTLLGTTRDPLLAWLRSLDPAVGVVLDPSSVLADLDEVVRERILARTGVWTSNAEEAAALTGAADIETAAPLVAARLPEGAVVVIRDGPRGCVVHEAGRTAFVPGFPQTPVDTNGAGDTHTGTLVAERVRGTGGVEAARRANAAGAITVTRRGPSTAPGREEIDALLAEHPG